MTRLPKRDRRPRRKSSDLRTPALSLQHEPDIGFDDAVDKFPVAHLSKYVGLPAGDGFPGTGLTTPPEVDVDLILRNENSPSELALSFLLLERSGFLSPSMTAGKEEPASAPTILEGGHCKAVSEKQRQRADRVEPRSDPCGRANDAAPRDLDSLSEEQLRKLTKVNTRRNHGGRASRFRSQVERVFRRLDNLAADVKLQPRYAIDALPIVDPDALEPTQKALFEDQDVHETAYTATDGAEGLVHSGDDKEAEVTGNAEGAAATSEQDLPQSREIAKPHIQNNTEQLALSNDEFEIEPATSSSVFNDPSSSMNGLPASVRSVRISTAVTVLDYKHSRPASVSKLQRYDHPTRTGKPLQARKAEAEELNFPKATKNQGDVRSEQRGAPAEKRKPELQSPSSSIPTQKETLSRPRRAHSVG